MTGDDSDALEFDDLIALDRRKLNCNGTSARITIPKASELGLVGKSDEFDASIAVRRNGDELLVTARIEIE